MADERFMVDGDGRKVAVVLDVTVYEKLLEDAEELETLRAYDRAKASEDEVLPLEKAISEIERRR